MTVSIGRLDNLVMNRGECAGPRTTFPHGGSALAEVSTLCNVDTYVAYIQWLSAMVNDIPTVLDVVRTELQLRIAKHTAAKMRESWLADRGSDAKYEAMDQAERALAAIAAAHESAIAKVIL